MPRSHPIPTPGPARPAALAGPRRRAPALALLAAACLAGGCATLQPEAALQNVQAPLASHLPADTALNWPRSPAEADLSKQRVAELLAQPLDADAAVQLALLNNPGLQARFEALGIAEAERVQASRLPNPGLSLGRLRQGDETELERSLHLSLGSLLTWPQRRALGEQQARQVQAEVAADVVALVADTRRAWVQAVAASEALHYRRQVLEAAQAGAELARRMAQVGNFSALQQAREQAFEAEAALDLARATQAEGAAREGLMRRLGLWGDDTARLRLPERLPALPTAPQALPDVEQRAIAGRLDVRAALAAVEQAGVDLGRQRDGRLLDTLELGLMHNRSNEAPPQRGLELSLALPLFDAGEARVARATHLQRQRLQQAADVAIRARSEAREAYGGYRSAWDIARHHRDQLVPLQARISEQNLLRYNGMFIGVFELLADARSQIGGVAAAMAALRDFWLAQIALEQALLGPATLPAAPAAGPSNNASAAPGAGH